LAWLLDRGTDVVPIPGTRRIERLDENAAAARMLLSDVERSQLDAVLAAHPVAGTRYPEAAMAALNG
jgi:aryl-alcohol dehydrogenase-like predicted oxidoreductase